MLKKIILSFVIILIILLTATGFLYANNKNPFNKGKSNQEINEEDISISDTKIYHITSSRNHGGIISLKGNQFVENGDSIPFTITANDGYKIVWVRIDNTKIKNITSNTYTETFDNVDKNHTIHAHFKKVK